MTAWRRAFARAFTHTVARVAPRFFLRSFDPTPDEVGRAGEALAARYLERRGWRVVARRLVTSDAEIDLVCRAGGRWVCVEVKTGRAGARFRPGQRVDRRRLARLRRAAGRLAGGGRARVDLVEVLLDAGGAPRAIEHHRDLRRPL